jgi:two-component system sensor histidine kinase MprB
VQVYPADGRAELAVEDDGPGITDEDLPHVFERLYVAPHRPVRSESGSGLGLAIVRQLVELMGGTVSAGRSPGGGARLTVSLPAS